ncbi:MAG: putative quinol monooxygenase [Novosphingobium sp.]
MPSMINIAEIRAQDGKSVELGEALTALVPPTRAEPGCLGYDLAFGSNGEWVMIEEWRDGQALAEHYEQPYVVEFLGRIGDLVAGEPNVRSYTRKI